MDVIQKVAKQKVIDEGDSNGNTRNSVMWFQFQYSGTKWTCLQNRA